MQDVKYLKDQKYKRTKKGLVTKIYALQKSHSKKRGHSFPVYSKNDLKTWLYSQPTFHLIYSNWVANNYVKDLTPSCDRLSNKLGYSLDNLQVITWLENKKLGEKDMREGNLPNCRTPYRPVVQRCKKTLAYVNHYISLHDAYRLTGISQGNISKAANGKQKSAGGYIWQLIPDGMRYNKELDKLVLDVTAGYIKDTSIPLDEVKEKNHRDYNIGSSNYASMKIQPWDVWKDWKLDPWDADIIKRISRTKEIPGKSFEDTRIEDYEKIKHICDEKIYQLKEKINAK